MHKERKAFSPKYIQNDKINFNSEKNSTKIKNIYENEFNLIFNDILNLSKKDFFEEISSRVKKILNGEYNIEINNNEKTQSMLNYYYKQYEKIFDIYFDELNLFLEEYKKNKNNGMKNTYISNFRKHCWKTGEFAIHNCNQRNKAGKFLPVYVNEKDKIGHKRVSSQYIANRFDKFKEEKQLKYIICIDCNKVFFENKFLNYCENCDIDYYSNIIINKKENENLLPGMWENDHCELLIKPKMNCPKCNGPILLDIKYNILKCLKCKYYKSPKNIERICNICKIKFVSDILIYNPFLKDQLNNAVNDSIIAKSKAYPSSIKCCNNINIFSSEFHHSKSCKGKLYLVKFNKKLIIFCSECKKYYFYEKFIWTCPQCGKEFKDEKFKNEMTPLLLKNEFDISQKNIYNKNSVNSYIESSRRKIYDKNSINSNNSFLKSDKKLDNNLINNLKENHNTINEIKLDKKYFNSGGNRHKNEIKVKCKNSYISDINHNKEEDYDSKNNNKKKKDFRQYIYLNNNTSLDKDWQIKNKKINSINKSEDNLFKYRLNKEKVTNNKSIIQNYKKNIPINSERRILINIKKENNYDKIKNTDSNLIFKRNNNPKFNISLNEKNKKTNIFGISINGKNNIEKNKNHNITQLNIYKENTNNYKNSSTSYIYAKSQINISKNKSNEIKIIKEIKKKEEVKKNIQINKNSQNKRYLRGNNPFNQIISQKTKIKNYLIKNYRNNGVKEDSKIELNKSNKRENHFESNKKEKIKDNSKILDNKKYEKKLKIIIKEKATKEKEINEKGQISKIDFSSPKKKEIKIQDNMAFSPIPEKQKEIERSESVKKIEKNEFKNMNEIKKIIQSNSVSDFRVKNKFYFKNKKENSEKNELQKLIELEKKKLSENKPDDIVEHRKIDYNKDVIIEDPYLNSHPDLYEKMQKNLKQMIFRSHLPLFFPERYQIEQKIGEGTNGSIYQVINLKSKKEYAMKKLTADSLISLKYLIKEFDLVYDVVHPNILSIYGMNIKCFDLNNFSLSVLMDLGETDWDLEINERLESHKYYTEKELISILKQLTSALLYLQTDKKIAHRDIKPENILIFKNNIYKLGDFGEAKGTKDNNKLNTLRGTDIYMSPILYNGLKSSKEDVVHNLYKSDVFSLGYSFLYAVSLNHNIINEIRDLEDIEKVKNILYRMMKPRYSDNFIEIILQMINWDEKQRIDFIGLDKLIKEKL